MRLVHLAAVAVVALAACSIMACVDVPANIRSAFAAPRPADRSNYRPGSHGTAPAAETPEPPPAPVEARPASLEGDGGVS
jgi:hypothetical protein